MKPRAMLWLGLSHALAGSGDRLRLLAGRAFDRYERAADEVSAPALTWGAAGETVGLSLFPRCECSMNIRSVVSGALLALVIVLSSTACMGATAREKVGAPVVDSKLKAVQLDVVRGINDGIDDGELSADEATLLASNLAAVQKDVADNAVTSATVFAWEHSLKEWARRGVQDQIDDGEISVGVADSLFERIERVTAALSALATQSGGAP